MSTSHNPDSREQSRLAGEASQTANERRARFAALPSLAPIACPRYIGDCGLRPHLGSLVPEYTCEPGAFTKREAVRIVLADRNAPSIAKGHGNRAARRMAQIESAEEFEAHCQWLDDMRAAQDAAEDIRPMPIRR